MWNLELGANFSSKDGVRFNVWAPFQPSLQVKIHNTVLPMEKAEHGYFHLEVQGLTENDTYSYVLANGIERPDPVSRYLPDGVFGKTALIDGNAFSWTDQAWKGISSEELIFYECHIGTFTPLGTFESFIKKIPYLKELGITCVELMPIAQFSGKWGWGYDGASLFATHNAYGDPTALKHLVNACHKEGIAVCLDVVYNHFGPEGCFIGDFGPYWSDRYQGPWGKAVNYDGAYSDGVRHYILQNILYWLAEYHIDALRFDALHEIFDYSAEPFFPSIRYYVENIAKEQKRKIHLIAESDLNDSKLILPKRKNGLEFDAWWNEDFHHALHVSLTKEKHGYYQDFQGLKDLKKTLSKGVVYDGKYSEYRKKQHGSTFEGIEPKKFISFLQNHDQIGNRAQGDRIATHISFEMQKMSALFLLLSPYLPLLFMGQEYSDEAHFEYFVDYQNAELLASVYEGRKREFHLESTDLPQPDKEAYLRSKLNWNYLEHPQKNALLKLYRFLIHFRRTHPIFRALERKNIKVHSSMAKNFLALEYFPSGDMQEGLGIFCDFSTEGGEFKSAPREVILPFTFQGKIELLFHTEQSEFMGNNSIAFDANIRKLSSSCACGAAFRFSYKD